MQGLAEVIACAEEERIDFLVIGGLGGSKSMKTSFISRLAKEVKLDLPIDPDFRPRIAKLSIDEVLAWCEEVNKDFKGQTREDRMADKVDVAFEI